VLDTNLTGAFRCARAAVTLMARQRSGHLIHIGSWAARAGTLGQTGYAAAKAGLIGLSHSLALEYGRRGVQSNVVLPGFLETKFTSGVPAAAREATLARHALGRFNTTLEAAAFLAHLARMRNVSGQVFQLDSRVSRWT
jgi:3-oxoacyl-[acyl-carrier protein] reductase